jgi:hypothetical protein
MKGKPGAPRKDEDLGGQLAHLTLGAAARHRYPPVVSRHIHCLRTEEKRGAGVLGPRSQSPVQLGAVHDVGERLIRLVRRGNPSGRVDRPLAHGTNDNTPRKVKALEGFRPDDAGAIHRLANDRMLFEDGDVHPSGSQSFGRCGSGRPGAHYQHIVGLLHGMNPDPKFR